MSYSARLSSFHTVSPEFNPFTVYVITVRKSGQPQWQVFRRYREWEDLRARIERVVGTAPPMPKKNIFGRMRPEVIERRVQGLNEFLQLCITNPSYAGLRDLADFLEREKNVAPEGLDMSTDSELRESEVGGAADASPVGERQQMLHQLIQSAQSNFIKLSHEPALLDDVYAQERARAYAVQAKALSGVNIGGRLALGAPAAAPAGGDAAAAAAAALQVALAAPSPAPAELALAQQTAAAAAQAVAAMAGTSRQLLVPVEK